MHRCSSCLSMVEAGLEVCPQCLTPVGKPAAKPIAKPASAGTSSSGLALGIAVGLVLGIGGTLAWQRLAPESRGPGTAVDAAQKGLAIKPPVEDPTNVPAEEKDIRRRCHVALRSEADPTKTSTALLLRAVEDPLVGIPYLVMPLEQLPLHGGFVTTSGSPIELRIVHADERSGFVLLAHKDRSWPPQDLEALRIGSLGTAEFQVLEPSGKFAGPVYTPGRTSSGARVQLSREVAAGAVLIDDAGLAVALAAGPKEAIALDQVALWLGRPAEQTLLELQKTLRSRDAELVLADGRTLLDEAKRDQDAAKARSAVALFEHGLTITRDQELWKSLDEHFRLGWLVLVRLGSQADPVQALAEALRGTQRLPDHWALIADTCLLQIEHGDPIAALALYSRLAAGSSEHATAIAEPFARVVAKLGRSRVRERRVQEALDLLDRAVTLFPKRADLQIALSEALAAAGRLDEAARAAESAAALDPSFAKDAESMATVAQRAKIPGVLQIPFDPATNIVNAKVLVSGRQLNLVIDTGATLTTIPSSLADDLQLRRAGNQRVKVNTASGTVEGEVVLLPSLWIGPIEVKNVQAVVLDLPDSLAGKGLLGLNVLQRLNMEIDSQNGMLVLKQGTPRRGR